MKPNFGISSAQVNELLCKQFATWPLVAANYHALETVKIKSYSFGDFSVKVQFNPSRIISSEMENFYKNINNLPCPLCTNNLPVEQERLPFGTDYIVLCNPYPIFPSHFTIPSRVHSPQRILSRFGDLLELSRKLDKFTLFYNGPFCGASVPNHAHFQAGSKGVMPFYSEIELVLKTKGELILSEATASLYGLFGIFRNCLVIKARTLTAARKLFGLIYQSLPEKTGDPEPMMNILCEYMDGTWTVAIFPRTQHRPRQYNSTDKDKLRTNPGAVDMGGLFITSRNEDFEKITSAMLLDIYKQICISEDSLRDICNYIQKLYSK